MKANRAVVLLGALMRLTSNPTSAQERTSRIEIEAGVITTRNMEIHGYNQGNATEGWKKNGADVRMETLAAALLLLPAVFATYT